MNKKIDYKFCKDCVSHKVVKGTSFCESSRQPDPVTGNERRECRIERLDGIGRCGTMANNFTAKKKKDE